MTPTRDTATTRRAASRRSGRAWVGRTSLPLLFSLAGLLAVAAPASAHTTLLSSSPGEQEVLVQSPSAVSLTFTRPLSSQFATVTVTGPDELSYQVAAAEVSGASVVQALRMLQEPGTYRADWRAVADDGHPLTGTLSFVYGTPADGEQAAAAPVVPASSLTGTVARPPADTAPDPVVVAASFAALAAVVLTGTTFIWWRSRPVEADV